MTTTVVTSIGSVGALTSWISGLNGLNLIVADQIQQGQLTNAEFTAAGVVLDTTGVTCITDTTRYVELTTAAGASFRDNANVRTNPLYYDATKGAGLRNTSGSGSCVTITSGIANFNLTNLQISCEGSVNGVDTITRHSASGFLDVWANCIIQGGNIVLDLTAIVTMNNCVIINSTLTFNRMIVLIGTNTLNCNCCTLVAPPNVSPFPSGDVIDYSNAASTATFTNCAMFGATSALALNGGSATITYNHCATDLSAPTGTGNIGGLTYASQFISTTTDFFQKAGSAFHA